MPFAKMHFLKGKRTPLTSGNDKSCLFSVPLEVSPRAAGSGEHSSPALCNRQAITLYPRLPQACNCNRSPSLLKETVPAGAKSRVQVTWPAGWQSLTSAFSREEKCRLYGGRDLRIAMPGMGRWATYATCFPGEREGLAPCPSLFLLAGTWTWEKFLAKTKSCCVLWEESTESSRGQRVEEAQEPVGASAPAVFITPKCAGGWDQAPLPGGLLAQALKLEVSPSLGRVKCSWTYLMAA